MTHDSNKPVETLAVTQEDREAALLGIPDKDAQGMVRVGEWDHHPLVQDAARRRLSSTPTADRNAVLEREFADLLSAYDTARGSEGHTIAALQLGCFVAMNRAAILTALSRTTPAVTDEAVERMAQAFYERGGFPNPTWDDLSEHWKEFNRRGAREALAVLTTPAPAVSIDEIVAVLGDAADYLTGDAGAWETGAEHSTRREYLMHSAKLRRDVAERARALLSRLRSEQE
jgi:hypothetical protein